MLLLTNLILGSLLLISGVWLFSDTLGNALKNKIPSAFTVDSPVKIFWASTVITAILQSSTAISLLTISFANCGLLRLSSAMAAIYGANLGTCATAQIMTLDIAEYGLQILFCGILLMVISIFLKPVRYAAYAVSAIGMLFTGLMTLNFSMPIIKNSPYIMDFINTYGNSKINLLLAGFVITALINSSSAAVALTMTLFTSGVLSFAQAVYIIFGDNIGTCLTALIAAQGTGYKGKQVALGHVLYNTISTLVVCIFADAFINAVIYFTDLLNQPDYFLVANTHLLFNFFGAISFMPINKYFCSILELVYKNKTEIR